MLARPDRLEPDVGEAQVEDLRHAHLPEEVVDPVQLGLVDVLVDLVGQRTRRLEVVAERLLDDDARPVGEAGVGEALDDVAEEEGRDLEVEDRRVRVVDRGGQRARRSPRRRSRRRCTTDGPRSGRTSRRRASPRWPRSTSAPARAGRPPSNRRPRRRRSGSRADRGTRADTATGRSSAWPGRR